MKAKLTYIVLTLVLVFSLIAVIIPTSPVSALTIWYVDDDNCPGTGTLVDPFCSIQNAIGNASADDIIIIAAGTYNEHDITINKSLIIQGAGEGSTFVDGEKLSRVFYINNSTVVMSGMTIRNGNTTVITPGNDGGGIFNLNGNLTLTNCIIIGNEATDNGGGVYNHYGTFTMTNCTVSGNKADNGGGIYNYGGQVTMTNCTVSDNTARAGNGGGISTVGPDFTLTMTNCTISGNKADNGGGIYNYLDEVTLTNCTVSDNEAGDDGGGIYNEFGDLTLTCTIVYGNRASGSMKDVYNIFNGGGTYTATESIVGDPDPLLGPLQYNGGPTKTHALMPGSPAIDTCIDCTVVAILNGPNGPGFGLPLVIDQRWRPRPVDGDLDGDAFCDVGAYEKQILAVGGIVEPVDKLSLLAPWIGLAALLVIAMVVVVLFKRRRVA